MKIDKKITMASIIITTITLISVVMTALDLAILVKPLVGETIAI